MLGVHMPAVKVSQYRGCRMGYISSLFPSQRDKKKCVMWSRLCGKPEYQLNLSLSPSLCILKF